MSQEPTDPKDLLSYVFANYRRLLKGIMIVCMRSATIAPLPFFFQVIIDEYVAASNTPGIASMSLLIVGLLFVHYVLSIEGARLFAIEVSAMIAELRSRVFQKLQFIHFGYLDSTKSGRLLSKYAFDTQKIEMALMPMVNQLLPNLFYSISVILILFLMNWQLSLIVLGIVPLHTVSKLYFFKKMQSTNREARVAQEKLTGTASEYISALRLVRGYGEEQQASGTLEESSETYRHSRVDQIMVNSVFGTFAHVSTQILTLIVIAGGALLVLRGSVTLGTLFAFLAALPIILMPIQMFIQFSQQYFVAKESYWSIRELLDSRYVEEWKGSRKIASLQGGLTFEHVHFSYPKAEEHALNDFDLTIQPGEHVALVGPSGSGKSTTANLILGLYSPTKGRILIDEVPQNQLDMQWLRKQCSIVMQESLLLSGSILENIRFARWDASFEEVEAAARQANAAEFIQQLPKGYDTVIGERGVSLSGGQRQRISIARAILRDPRILILDEATSALDYESERLIQEALDRLANGRTVITIAHRLSTIKKADRIVVLQEGQIIEEGGYEELAQKGSYFKELLSAQSR